jgi:hypothetical protein
MKKATAIWTDPNVHAWSARFSDVLMQCSPQLVAESREANLRCRPEEIKRVLQPVYHSVVDKIVSRRNVSDGDLCGVNPLGLLQLVWEEIEHDVDGVKSLEDNIADIGMTCLQGDTHRLFAQLVALRLSKGAREKKVKRAEVI